MSLSELMSHAGLAFYAEVGLVIFLAVFVIIAVRTLRPGRRREFDAMSRLPFDDDARTPTGEDALPHDDPTHGAPARRRADG